MLGMWVRLARKVNRYVQDLTGRRLAHSLSEWERVYTCSLCGGGWLDCECWFCSLYDVEGTEDNQECDCGGTP